MKEIQSDVVLISLSRHELRQLLREEVQACLSTQITTTAQASDYEPMETLVRDRKVSESLLYKISSKRLVTTKKIGRRLYFNVAELEAYFARTTKKSLKQLESDLDKGVFSKNSRAKSH